MKDIRIVIDTNVWIFAILQTDNFSRKIIHHLDLLNTTIPNQVRAELQDNLGAVQVKEFHQLINKHSIEIDFHRITVSRISAYEQKGLKKGDAEIAAYCEWQNINILVSDNRDFLRGLVASHPFRVLSPKEFCLEFDLQ